VTSGLAALVADRLQEMDRSRRWLAERIGVSPQTINNLMHGGRPDVVTLSKLAVWLDRPLPALLRLVGLSQASDVPEGELDWLAGEDWTLLEMVNLMRPLSLDQKTRLLKIAKLFVAGLNQN
jgi:transcriptional regulator with XRE-family HTH domain